MFCAAYGCGNVRGYKTKWCLKHEPDPGSKGRSLMRATRLRVYFGDSAMLSYDIGADAKGDVRELADALNSGRCLLMNATRICVEFGAVSELEYDENSGWCVYDRREGALLKSRRLAAAGLPLHDAVHFAETMHHRPIDWRLNP
jgi:hypothetical protein